MKHPNTVAGGVAGALAIVSLYLGTLFGFDPPSYVAGAITTIVIAAVLFVGHSGLKGLIRLVYSGSGE